MLARKKNKVITPTPILHTLAIFHVCSIDSTSGVNMLPFAAAAKMLRAVGAIHKPTIRITIKSSNAAMPKYFLKEVLYFKHNIHAIITSGSKKTGLATIKK